MTTHTAVHTRLLVPRVPEFVDTIAEKTSTAFRNFESSANDRPVEAEAKVPAATTAVTAPWLDIGAAQSSSSKRKGGALALVVLLHAVVLYGLSLMSPQVKQEASAPLQIVTIATEINVEAPPPPPPALRIPEPIAPIEPEIPVDVVEANSITVTPRVTESASSAPTPGTPKIVSSVEYVREPVAKYPATARALKQRGTVMLRALIDTDGHAREVNVHRSSGHRLLDDTARDAVAKALFKPYTENGQSIPVYVFIPIEFG